MRFDGYFILSDWLDLPNLHGRSFALARWKLREWLFDLGEEKPEHFSPARETGLILFAWAVWIYRLVVFLGIAVLVYHFIIKLLGIFLFLVEIVWFIALPIRHELAAWIERWPTIRTRRRSRVSGLVFGVFLLLTVVPWPGRISASGLLHSTEIWPVFAPGPAQVVNMPWHEGNQIAAGTELIALVAPELQAKRDAAQARLERLRWQAASAGFDIESRNRLLSSQDEFATAEAELASLNEELARYSPKAPFAGRLRDLDPDLQLGQWLARKEKIAVLVGEQGYLVETWLTEDEVRRVQVGDSAIFMADGHEGPLLRLSVSNVDADATRVLLSNQGGNPAAGQLAAQFGGHILTRERNGQLIPEQAMYRVVFKVDSPLENLAGQAWRGRIVVHAGWEAPAGRYLRSAIAVVVREAGF